MRAANSHMYLMSLARRIAAPEQGTGALPFSYRKLRQKLLRTFGDSEIEQPKPFGSLTRGTLLSAQADPNRDIDVMVAFKHEMPNATPETYLRRVRDFVEQAYPTSICRRSSPAVVLDMHAMRVELVPAIRPKPPAFGGFRIPDTASERRSWVATFPDLIKHDLDNEHERLRYLRQLIRLLKYWNIQADRPFRSFEIEKQLIAAQLSPWAEGNRLPMTRSFASALELLRLRNDAAQHKRDKLQRARDRIREIVYLEFLGRWSGARAQLEKILPPVPAPAGPKPLTSRLLLR